MLYLAHSAVLVLVDVDEFGPPPRDVPETNAADFGFVSPLANTKEENESVNLIFFSSLPWQVISPFCTFYSVIASNSLLQVCIRA